MSLCAFTTWNHRIAPVFDTAPSLLLVEVDPPGVERRRWEVSLAAGGRPAQVGTCWRLEEPRVGELVALGVTHLVCGALARPVREHLESHRVVVTAFIAGEVEQVVQAFLAGRLEPSLFAMPGCRRRHCRRGGKPF